MGVALFLMNFAILADGPDLKWFEFVIIGVISIIYLALIGYAIYYPTSPLKPISKEDIEDHEYNRIEVYVETKGSDDEGLDQVR